MKKIYNNELERFINFSRCAMCDVWLLEENQIADEVPSFRQLPCEYPINFKINFNFLAVLVNYNFSLGNEFEPDKKLNISAFKCKFWQV